MLQIILFLCLSAFSWAEPNYYQTYDRPQTNYERPHTNYGIPQTGFSRPQSGNNRPLTGFDSPQSGFNRPQTSFNRPAPGYGSQEPDSFVFEDNSYQQSRNPSNPMEVLYSWKQLDFTFPNDNVREEMIRKKQYIPENVLILDVDAYGDGPNPKVFVSLPRVRPGVPVTLATVSQRKRNGRALLEPFPDWRSHTDQFSGDCDNSITSVFRTHVDECGRLWVLDSGNNNAFYRANNSIVCQPKVLVYDLRNNNRLIGKYFIPRSIIADNTLLVTIAVDIRTRDCSDAYAYIADAIAYKMIIFNHRTEQFWRINSILFFPYPDWSRFNINGDTFDLSGGLFGMALGPLYRGNRILYFHCIDGVRQSWVNTADLRNQSMWRSNMNAKPRAFNLFNGTRPSQSAAAAMNDQGIMFFGLIASNEIACWNSQTKFDKRNLVSLAKDDRTFQFASGIKILNNKLYVASDRLQKYMNYKVEPNAENYIIQVGDLPQMTRGTKCEVNYLSNRFDSEYMPDDESIDLPSNSEGIVDFTFAPN